VDISAWQLYDASGLSPLNRLDAASLAQVLRYMAKESPQAGLFFGSLPQAALEGTVAELWENLAGNTAHQKRIDEIGNELRRLLATRR
jgi:D-alanyl-D-alanine carboxypeptidase